MQRKLVLNFKKDMPSSGQTHNEDPPPPEKAELIGPRGLPTEVLWMIFKKLHSIESVYALAASNHHMHAAFKREESNIRVAAARNELQHLGVAPEAYAAFKTPVLDHPPDETFECHDTLVACRRAIEASKTALDNFDQIRATMTYKESRQLIQLHRNVEKLTNQFYYFPDLFPKYWPSRRHIATSFWWFEAFRRVFGCHSARISRAFFFCFGPQECIDMLLSAEGVWGRLDVRHFKSLDRIREIAMRLDMVVKVAQVSKGIPGFPAIYKRQPNCGHQQRLFSECDSCAEDRNRHVSEGVGAVCLFSEDSLKEDALLNGMLRYWSNEQAELSSYKMTGLTGLSHLSFLNGLIEHWCPRAYVLRSSPACAFRVGV